MSTGPITTLPVVTRGSATRESIDREVHGQTVVSRFLGTVAAHPDMVALHWKNRDGEGWSKLAFAGYAHAVARVTTSLERLGVGRGDRVVLMMHNRPEFHIADMATLMCGATPISLYNSSSPDQIRYLVAHAGAKVAIVEDVEVLERFLTVRAELPALEAIVIIDDPQGPGDVRSWADLIDSPPADLTAAAASVRPKDVATVIYTSGTTGPPKGVVLTHFNICWTAESYMHLLEIEPLGFRAVSYLPMAHVAERMSSHYLGAIHAYQVTTCPDPDRLLLHLREARPQIFFGVPRIWERLQAAVTTDLANDPKRKNRFDQGLAAARPVVLAGLERDLTGSERRTLASLDRRAFRPARDVIGLDTVELALTGAAPIRVEVLEWFLAIGVPISEIYGMSETTSPLTWDPYEIRPGTVGRPMPGVTVQLGEDGEVMAKGGNVFPGYLDDPARTAEALDADGWLRTGDIGEFDADGYLRIVDRKKELIITAGGENVSPANLEAALLSLPLVAQACAVGDGRPFVAALVVLDPDAARAWAQRRHIRFSSLSELARHAELTAEIEAGVEAVMSDFNDAERVKKVLVIGEEWLPDSEELTPTLKLKRGGVRVKYAAEIEALYA